MRKIFNTKRYKLIAMSLLTALALTACGGSNNEETTKKVDNTKTEVGVNDNTNTDENGDSTNSSKDSEEVDNNNTKVDDNATVGDKNNSDGNNSTSSTSNKNNNGNSSNSTTYNSNHYCLLYHDLTVPLLM